MARSNTPQALSVISVTHEGNVPMTVQEIVKFDGLQIGFSHSRTWAAMPAALQGVLRPEDVRRQLGSAHPRVAKTIAALCRLGTERPVRTYDLSDHPNAGIRPVEGLRIGPDVVVVAKASCWFVRDGRAVIPLLQPRLADVGLEKLAYYAALGRRAFCRGDWIDAAIELIDLSGGENEKEAHARVITEEELPDVDEERLIALLQTFVEAQAEAAKVRASREKKDQPKRTSQLALFGEPERDER